MLEKVIFYCLDNYFFLFGVYYLGYRLKKAHNIGLFCYLAETVGFEPTGRVCATKRFRVVLVMTTSIHLRMSEYIVQYSDC